MKKAKYIQMRTKGNNIQAITCQGYRYIIFYFVCLCEEPHSMNTCKKSVHTQWITNSK